MANAEKITRKAADEYYRATSRFPPFNSAHEGYAVILEELDELWTEVKDNKRPPAEYIAAMRKEAEQVAAMAIRFIADVCEDGHISQDRSNYDPDWECFCGDNTREHFEGKTPHQEMAGRNAP